MLPDRKPSDKNIIRHKLHQSPGFFSVLSSPASALSKNYKTVSNG
jgi:hypothetical protein